MVVVKMSQNFSRLHFCRLQSRLLNWITPELCIQAYVIKMPAHLIGVRPCTTTMLFPVVIVSGGLLYQLNMALPSVNSACCRNVGIFITGGTFFYRQEHTMTLGTFLPVCYSIIYFCLRINMSSKKISLWDDKGRGRAQLWAFGKQSI